MVEIHPSARVAASAVLTGDVSVGPGATVLPGAVLNGDQGTVTVGQDALVMEHAVLRGRARHALTVGDAVLVGPHAHLNGATIEDEVFVATGTSVFAGATIGAGSELRINSVVHVNTAVAPGTVVPIGWIAVGSPAQLFPPDQHDALWAVQKTLDFPQTMYGVPRETPMRELMRAQSEALHASMPAPVAPEVAPPDGLPRYRLITGPDDATFCRRVSEALDQGYVLHGTPAVTTRGDTVVAAQAVLWQGSPR